MVDPPRTEQAVEVGRRPPAWRIAWRVVLLLVAAFVLYGLAPQLLAVWGQVPKLESIHWWWFAVVFALEAGSLVCLWWLVRIALPGVPWFVAGTSQLASNAVAKTVPGGGAIGAALNYRMLSVSGVAGGSAASALAATGLLSTWVLFALPFVALLGTLIGAPVPRSLSHVAWAGAAIFFLMFGLGLAVVRTDRALLAVGRLIERVAGWVLTRLHRPCDITAEGLIAQRNEMVSALGSRFTSALAAALGNWMLDYLALVAALYAVGSRPRPSLVLLAFAVSAVLTMIPITPGGLGFVEAGLTATLTAAGVPAEEALLATLAYRLASYWLPLPAGAVAYLLFRREFGRPPNGATDAGELAGAD